MQTTTAIGATVILALASCTLDAKGDDTGVVSMVGKVMSLVDSGESLTYFRQSSLSTNPLALKVLHEVYAREESTPKRLALVELICGTHALSRSNIRAEHTGLGNKITNNVVVNFLLDAINDKEVVVRERAMKYLCEVDARCLKGHEKEIVQRIDMDGPVHVRNITYFLGRLGPEGLEYLRGTTNDKRFVVWYTKGALAKAGDKDATHWVKKEFECANEERKWFRLDDMVYFGREVSGMSVAKLLRSGRGNESSNHLSTLRFAALKGLGWMYPEEKAVQFDWSHFSEETYIQAEKWAEEYFHISWTNDRPTFIPLDQQRWRFEVKPF